MVAASEMTTYRAICFQFPLILETGPSFSLGFVYSSVLKDGFLVFSAFLGSYSVVLSSLLCITFHFLYVMFSFTKCLY